MAQEQIMKPTSLSGNKGTGNASVDADALPFTFTPMPMAFKPPADDPLIQIFEKLGKKLCFKCHKKVQTESMVLCQCGYFICRECYLAGCYCTEEWSGSAASTPDKRKDSASTYYISVGSTSQEINLEGKEYQLECLFTCPMQM